MRIKPQLDGSRSLVIDSAYLWLNATVQADGTVQVHEVEVRDPRTPAAADLRLAEAKAKVCDTCEHSRGITRERNGQPVYGVKCTQCGCGLFKLLAKDCPIGRHAHLKTLDRHGIGDV